MIRVVHLFNVKRSVPESAFIAWLDARLDVITREFGCIERKTWILLDGFSGSYVSPRPVKDRPKYVNEAYWTDAASANRFREWLTGTEEGREFHDRWFDSIENHTVLRYVEGWIPAGAEE